MFEKMNILETVFCRIILQNQNTIVLRNQLMNTVIKNENLELST